MLATRSASVRLLRVLLAALALVVVLGLSASPSYATEGEGSEKTELPSNPHDQVGLVILAGAGVLTAAAGFNAVKQLRGERPQADGKIRWR